MLTLIVDTQSNRWAAPVVQRPVNRVLCVELAPRLLQIAPVIRTQADVIMSHNQCDQTTKV